MKDQKFYPPSVTIPKIIPLSVSLRIISVISGLVLAMSMIGCINYTPGAKIIVGNRDNVTEERALEQPLTGARTMSPIDLVLDPELHGKVILEGESNILEQVDIRQNGQGVLEVSFKPNIGITPTKTVVVTIPVMDGGLLETSSTGSIIARDNAVVTGDRLELRVSSTGSINITANVKTLKATDTSTGRIVLAGSAEQADIDLSSTGGFDGYSFKVVDATVSVSSTGSAYVTVSGDLVGTISSVGNIFYDGDPASVTSKGGGMGSLKKR